MQNTPDFKTLYIKDEKQIKKDNAKISELKDEIYNEDSKSDLYGGIGAAAVIFAFLGGFALMIMAG